MPPGRSLLPPLLKSLSARLLVLTIAFVMLAEVLIYAPSIGRFRLVWLEERIAAAHLAALALEAPPDNMVSEELASELLAHAGAHSIVLRDGDRSSLMLSSSMPPQVNLLVDLREETFFGLILDAFMVLAQDDNRVLRVLDSSPRNAGILVEVVIDETPMRLAMYDYSRRILLLSVVISLFVSALVFLSLQLLMVFPLRRMTEAMTAFREDPEDQSRRLRPVARSDEIGVASRELHEMQSALRDALHQRVRLAAVGTAVTKINHDLRAILATASLVSDRLANLDDPEARRLAPRIIESIDRAVSLCSQTLQYAKGTVPAPGIDDIPVRDVVDEVGASLPARGARRADGAAVEWENAVPPELVARADREQLFRVLANLGGNAAEAGATRIRFSAGQVNGRLTIEVSDNGPGLAPRARENLFRPFAGSTRDGGTGLGLAISRDLMRAQGGELELADSSEAGTCFRAVLPAGGSGA